MKSIRLFTALALLVGFFCANATNLPVRAQSNTSVAALYNEVKNYVRTKSNELAANGKRYTRDVQKRLQKRQRSLAKKYAKETSSRSNLKGTDYYYLGLLYFQAGDDRNSASALNTFINNAPAGANGMVQSARSYALISCARTRQSKQAEKHFLDWRNGIPMDKSQQPFLGSVLAIGLFKDKKYEDAVKYASESFEILKSSKTKTVKEARDKEKIYMNLVEVLSLSYKKSKDKENALAVLAEARVRSFTLPSAALYRKVMNFVDGSGFSEKKLMKKVESIQTADAAPEIDFVDWIGHKPSNLSDFRGKIVLLDFWATWCGPCITTFPRLRKWHKKYKDDDFVVLGITKYYGQGGGKRLTRLQELDFLNRFIKKYKLNYPIAIAKGGEDSSKYGINAYPTTLLVDGNGVVRYIGIGAGSEEIRNLEGMIKKLIKEKRLVASNNY